MTPCGFTLATLALSGQAIPLLKTRREITLLGSRPAVTTARKAPSLRDLSATSSALAASIGLTLVRNGRGVRTHDYERMTDGLRDVLDLMHGRSRLTIAPRTPTTPGYTKTRYLAPLQRQGILKPNRIRTNLKKKKSGRSEKSRSSKSSPPHVPTQLVCFSL